MKLGTRLIALTVAAQSSFCSSIPNLSDLMVSKYAVVDMSDAELQEASRSGTLGPNYSIYEPLRSSRMDDFGGTGDTSVVPIIREIFAGHSAESLDDCLWLFGLLINRPDWIFVHRTEIIKLRMCTLGLVGKLSSIETTVDAMTALDTFIRRVLDIVYSPSVEKAMRESRGDGIRVDNSTILFRAYMMNLLGDDFSGSASPFLGRIAATIQESSIPSSSTLDERERPFFEKFVALNFTNKLLLNHYGEFLTSVWGHAVDRGNEANAIWLFKVLLQNIPNYDEIDLRLAISELLTDSRYAYRRTYFHQTIGMGAARGAFMELPGNFLVSLWMANMDNPDAMAALDACMPSDYTREPVAWGSERAGYQIGSNLRQLYYAMDGVRGSEFGLFRCLIDTVLSERVSMPMSEPEFRKATSSLLYILMLLHSADATAL